MSGSLFQPGSVPVEGLGGDPLVIAVQGSTVCLHECAAPGEALFIGVLDGRPVWAIDADAHGHVDEDAFYKDLRMMWGAVDETTWHVAGRGIQLVEWARTHRFCGRCGTPTEDAAGERAKRCPACKLTAFPRLAPAVITLVEHPDGRALLARNAGFPGNMHSCLAGFVEPGESLEECVRREVKEEVGVVVGPMRYVASQPWPFPHSLMIGFAATWASGEIEVDGVEIAEAAWFTTDDLPPIPPRMSIARRLIDEWIARN